MKELFSGKIKKNMIFMLSSMFIVQLLNFVTISFMGKKLSVEMFGRVGFSQAVMLYFVLFTLLGFQTLGTKEVIKTDKRGQLVTSIVSLRLGAALVSIISIFIGLFLFNKDFLTNRILALYAFTLIPLAFNLDWFFTGIYEMKYNGVYNILKSVMAFGILLLFLKDDSNVLAVPISVLVGGVIAGSFHLISYIKKGYRFERTSGLHRKRLIIIAIPFVAGSILSTINGNIDILMIKGFLDERSVGLYSGAYKIIFFLLSLITVLFNVIYPLLTKFKDDALEGLMDKIIRVSMLIGIPIAAGGVIFAESILESLFNNQFVEGANTLRILCIYFLVLFWREICAYSLNAWERERYYTKVIAVSAGLNIVLNFFLIREMGINGGALATLLCEVFTFILMRKGIKSKVRVSFIYHLKNYLPLGLSLICFFIVMRVMNLSVIVVIPISVIIYLTYLIKTGVIKELTL